MVNGTGTSSATAGVVYTEATFDGGNFGSVPHYVIETAISLTSLGWNQGDSEFNVALQWGMNCSNDWINGSGSWTNPNTEPGPTIPEPTALALMAIGMIGVGYSRRRRKPSRGS